MFIISMAFKIASASAEKIEHSFVSLDVKSVFSNMIAIPTPSYEGVYFLIVLEDRSHLGRRKYVF